MKSIFTILLVLVFCSLNSCKKESQDIDASQNLGKLKSTYFLSDQRVGIDFSNEENSINIIGVGKVLPNDKTGITHIIYRNTKINFLEIIRVDSDFLIKSIQVITPESNREVRFSNYKLQERIVTVEVINISTNTSLVKTEINLTGEAINLLSSLQTSNKKLAGARIASQDCNGVAGGFKTFFTAVECLTGTILVPIRDKICTNVNAALPSKISEWAFPCNSAGADFFNKGKELACNLKDQYFDNEVLPCLPDRDKDLDDFNSCLENAIRPPVTPDEAWGKTNKCFDDFNKKKREKENQSKNPPAHGTGEPHFLTFDGTSYDFQGHGEFTATKSTVDNFEVQVRQEDVYKNGVVTANTGIAIQTGNDILCATINPKRLYINKQVQDFTNFTSVSLKDGATIAKTKENGIDVLKIVNKNGDVVKVVFPVVEYLDYYLYLADNRKGKVIGLMGNFDGDKINDIQTRSGENILVNGSLAFDKLYPTYADSWRITQANSLFYYDTGKSTDTYTQKDFPRTLQTLTAAQKASAESVCRAAGVTTEPFLSNCIFDVAITNNNALANSAFLAQNNASNVSSSPVTITPPLNQATIINFNDIKQIELKGDAKVVNGCIRLTDANFNIVGAAYYKSTVSGNFESEFTFKISELKSGGADGFAFIVSKDIPALNGAEGIGYQGTKSSLAVEFDTWQNSNLGDPNDNHISIHTNGQDANSANESYSIGSNDKVVNLSDGKEHKVKVVYQNKAMEIFLDGSSIIKAPIDLINKLGLSGNFYIGFTAATGGASEIHDICSWTIKSL